MTTRTARVTKAAGGLLAAAAVLAPAADAATYQVNSLSGTSGNGTCDETECTLREAVNTANGHANDPAGTPDVVTFASSVRGTIQLDSVPSSDATPGGAIPIKSDSLDIQGPGADQLTIAGPEADRIFKLFGFATPDETVTISGLTLTGGSASVGESTCLFDPGDGGAILSTNSLTSCQPGDAAELTVSKVVITDNEAEGGGGGIAVETNFSDDKRAATGSAALNVSQSTIDNNSAERDGGGIVIYPQGSALSVSDSTLADNGAGGTGGAISVINNFNKAATGAAPATFDVQNSTITGNDSGSDGGGIFTQADMSLRSSIVFGNTTTPPEVPSKATTASDLATNSQNAIDAGFSDIGTRVGATVTDVPGEPNISADPELGTLQINGGTTQTRLPATTSPVVDAGAANGLTAEQRDTARTIDRPSANVADGTDIGAVELPADPPPDEPDEPVIVPGPSTELCLGKQVVLTKGGDADEKLTGFGADDGILGGGGQDQIFGIGGDDCLFGQVGNDKVEGGPGNDNANGDRDDDVVKGDGGDDSVRGQNGNDRVFGGPGSDPKVTGGAGDDLVKGGDGDDFVKGDGGNDVIVPGGGADFVHAGGGADVVNSDDGHADQVICGTGKDVANVDELDDVDKDCNVVNVIGGPHTRVLSAF